MQTQNHFLRVLTDAQIDLLRPEACKLPRRSYIYRVDDEVTHLYFMERGLVTLIRPLPDGQRVPAWSYDGTVIGAQIRFWIPETVYDIYIRIGGDAWRVSRSRFLAAMLRDPGFQRRVLNWVLYFDGSMAEAAGCVAVHSVEQRLCRYLLKAQYAMKGEPSIPLALSEFADMLATAKSHVYRIAQPLEDTGALIIRGRSVTVTNEMMIAERSCACWQAVNHRRDRALADEAVPHGTA